MIENKGERLTTLGFGIPNLLKFGNVGYFPEQFIVDMGLQGKTALEIKRFFMSCGFDIDGDVVDRYDNTNYFVDLKHNVFIKYYPVRESYKRTIELLTNAEKLDDDKKRYIKWLCRENAKIDRECGRLVKEKLNYGWK